MSGGVDSSVTAALLARQDFDLRAVFMRNWDTRDEKASDTGCEWEKDWEDVQRVCKMLDIPCSLVDLSQPYWNRVFQPALDEWADGYTPNPDVSCNREIKFGALMDSVLQSPAKEWLATGHYAQVLWTATGNPRPRLVRSRDLNKDQTYYLSAVPEAKLRQALFPIGHLTKPEVRELAASFGLPTASRDESMGICFVGQKQRFDSFLSNYLDPQPGDIIDVKGRVIGTHTGIWSLTIGQGARISGQSHKMYIARKDIPTNTMVAVDANDHPMLMCKSLTVKGWSWIWENHRPHQLDSPDGYQVTAQIRHRMKEAKAVFRVSPGAGEYKLTFDVPQHAVAEGQILVLWDGDWCLGSGRIDSVHTLHDAATEDALPIMAALPRNPSLPRPSQKVAW
ncbi:5-methylaminomethyl-2-thiouridylate-methyltransferase [Clavulina sp. PMI_390]|nr:5-methylaminomethyl-2-thiouridylate-methyltransferase [Clavulina sp. PMI_390]